MPCMSQAGYLSEKGKGRVGEFTMRVEFQTAFRAYGEMQGKGREGTEREKWMAAN